MKITFFTDTFIPTINGVVTSLDILSQGLAEVGQQVMIVAPSSPSNSSPDNSSASRSKKSDQSSPVSNTGWSKVQVLTTPAIPANSIYPDLRLGFISPQLVKGLRAFKPDLIHVATPPGTLGFTGLLLAELLGVAKVGAFHGYVMKPEYLKILGLERGTRTLSGWLWKLFRLVYRRYPHIISPSQSVKRDLKKHGFLQDISVIPNPFRPPVQKRSSSVKKDENIWLQSFFKKHRLTQNNLKLVYVGRLSKEKNLEALLRAFQSVVERAKEARLLLIGNGPIKKDLQELAVELGVDKKTIFAGAIPHQTLIDSRLLEKCQVFVSTSTSEVQPMSFIEAMYFGLPLVLADNPQNREFIKKNGQAANSQKPPDFAKAILETHQLNQAGKLSQQSRIMAERHQLTNVCRQHIKLYDKLVGQAR